MARKNYSYELWAIGYTEDEGITDYDELVAEFPHTETGKMEGLQKLRTIQPADLGKLPDDVKLVHFALEEVADFSKTERSAVDIVGERWVRKSL